MQQRQNRTGKSLQLELEKARKESSEAIYEARRQATDQVTKIKTNNASIIATEKQNADAAKARIQTNLGEQQLRLRELQDQIRAEEAKLKALQDSQKEEGGN